MDDLERVLQAEGMARAKALRLVSGEFKPQ